MAMQFAIFRVGERKYKTLQEIKHYKRHMEREADILNADPSRTGMNVTLIGDKNIIEDVEEYTKGIKMRKNGVLARELLMTASPEWVTEATQEMLNEWVNINLNWLEDEFGDNIRHCVLHLDESTAHLHALCIPRFEDDKKGYVLANARYFDGPVKLSAYQDRYSEAMQELGLNRGLKWSKATHTQLRVYYNLINKKLNTEDIKQVVAKANNSELLEKQIKELNQTLNSYKDFNSKSEIEKAQLCNKYMRATEDKELLQECIRYMSDLYKIPQQHIKNILKSISQKEPNLSNFEGEVERERSKGTDNKRE